MTEPSDVCSSCRHQRHHHKRGEGICVAVMTKLTDVTNPTTCGQESTPCHCNRFATKPTKTRQPYEAPAITKTEPAPPDLTPTVVPGDPHITGCCGEPVTGADHICPIDLVPREFILAMGRIMRDGLDHPDRFVGSWKHLGQVEASTKTLNLQVHLKDGEFDSVACNALILWWHFQRETQDEPKCCADCGNAWVDESCRAPCGHLRCDHCSGHIPHNCQRKEQG